MIEAMKARSETTDYMLKLVSRKRHANRLSSQDTPHCFAFFGEGEAYQKEGIYHEPLAGGVLD